MRGSRKTFGTPQLVDLLAGNPGHPALLAILETIVDAAALSLRDNDALTTRRPAAAHPSSRLVCRSRGL
jgi:hypothetical protein